MSNQLVLLVLLLGSISLIIADANTAVYDLTDENFDTLTSKGKWLIEFYAPWCGHCKQLAPIYDESSLKLKAANSELNLGKVDCTVQTGVASKYDIRGYPTIKYFRSGVVTPYEGGRTLESIMDFAKRATRQPIESVTEETFDKFVKDNTVAFLLIGGSEIAKEVFLNVAKKLQESVTFGQAPSSLKSKFNRKEDGILVLLNDDEPVIYPGAFKEEDLVDWILKHRHPIFNQLGASNFNVITSNGKMTVIATVDPADSKTTAYLDTMKAVAKQNKNLFNFGYINAVEYASFVNRHGITKYPDFFVLDTADGTYRDSSSIKGPHDVQTINAYLADVIGGKVEIKGANGVDQVLRFIQSNLILVGSASLVIMIAVVSCCFLGMSSDTKPVKKD